MQWSMPRPVLQVVAALIGLIAIGSLVMGVLSAPQRGRLPGEHAPGNAGPAPIDAVDATPLGDERIQGPPPPKPLTDEEKAKLEADKEAKAEAAAETAAAATSGDKPPALAAKLPAKPGASTPGPGDRVGDLLDGVTPPPEEPPH